MLNDLELLPMYVSTENNIAEEFYNPVLKNSMKLDRISGYFSSKALATYAQGLEFFARNGYKYRLIVSKDISESDYLQMKAGYLLRKELRTDMITSLQEKLSPEEEKNISNLAYLISIGIVDMKIAFKKDGIFHDKCGIFWDCEGNILSYRGSNNETEAAIERNYEAFNIFCSWIDYQGFYKKGIDKSISEFNLLWDNKHSEIIVKDVDEIIASEILKYNKGELILEEILLQENAMILDYNKQLILHFNSLDLNDFISGGFYKINFKKNVEKIENQKIFFDKDLTYLEFEKINQKISKKMEMSGIEYLVTQRYKDYIQERNLHIESRSRLGMDIKNKNEKIIPHYEIFAEIVHNNMSRRLREKQMWDAFFMYAMTKSGNFSVPGSGKTSSVLGVYAFLKNKGLVNKIIMIGPKNAFGSWIDEFCICFENKETLKVFNVHDSRYNNSLQIKKILKYDALKYNLFLFNYESVGTYEQELKEIIEENTLLVFDEVHKVKRYGGEYAMHSLFIAENSSYTIALTGTPIPNSYMDLYNFLQILYKEEYKEYFGFDVQTLKNPSERDLENINTKLQPFFCRTTKKQLQVPAANVDIDIMVKTTQEEQKLFEIITSKYRNNKLALFIRILQLESNPQMLLNLLESSDFENILEITDEIEEIDYVDYSEEIVKIINKIDISSKKKACINQIIKLVGERKKVIVWCIFKDSIRDIEKKLSEKGILSCAIFGEVELAERYNLIDDFKKGKFDVLITNPHTLAESVSLHSICHDAIYFEYSYNLVHLLQSKDRIHRLGLSENQYTQYYYLKDVFLFDGKEGSIDNNVHKRLEEKEQIMLNAIDNNVFELVTTTEEDLELIFKGF